MDGVTDIMTKDKFIASVQRDEKINVKQMTVQLNSMWAVLSRLWHQENRAHTLSFLTTTIQRGFEILQNCMDSQKRSERVVCQHLANDLQACVPALHNLRYTYAHDRIFACSIHTLQEMMVARMTELAAHPSKFGLFPDLKSVHVEPNPPEPPHLDSTPTSWGPTEPVLERSGAPSKN
jgi:hypothetical protein